ncbi:DMT family transporter [Denitromonas iodatirespirans]|uniref:DMT family transporter n=1 Tax=Denitromonas iodatirespirans TaxID=2795389 RepID=A0A944H777_DENI1|nr:DMT family transporter [Denitromonas iodatirespirans]MBT0960909.1 DMT family transporter [Denitromonas iodatirespirans]
MLGGLSAALGAGLIWGMVFIVPLILPDYPGVSLAAGRYLAFGVLAVFLARADRAALKRLTRADWIEAAKLAVVGNLVYYGTLASAIQLAGAPVPTMIIGTLPVAIAIGAKLTSHDEADHGLPWSRLALPLGVIAAGLVLVHAQADTAGEVEQNARYWLGLGLAVVGLACWTWYPLTNSRWLRRQGPGLARPWATAQGLMTLPAALIAFAAIAAWQQATEGAVDLLGPRPGLFVLLMLLTGLLASWLGALLWNHASHQLPAALTGQLIVFETLAALTYAFVWYQRWPTPAEGGGIVLLIAGVVLAVRAFRRPRPAVPSPARR